MSGALNSNAAEVNAIATNAHLICEAITTISSVTWFSQKLEGVCLIAPQARREIMGTPSSSPYEKCDHLLNAVKVQVQADPSKFSKFLEILQSEDALKSYADTIYASLIHRELNMHFDGQYHLMLMYAYTSAHMSRAIQLQVKCMVSI